MRTKKLFIVLACLFSSSSVFACSRFGVPSAYYRLDITKGIEVYTHILDEDAEEYEYAFMAGTNSWKQARIVNRLIYVSIYGARDVIRSYGDDILPEHTDIYVIPDPCTDEDIRMAHIWYADLSKSIRNLLWELEG